MHNGLEPDHTNILPALLTQKCMITLSAAYSRHFISLNAFFGVPDLTTHADAYYASKPLIAKKDESPRKTAPAPPAKASLKK